MNLTEIFFFFKQEKSTTRSHIKNLIEMAAIDGNFDNSEYDLLKRIAKKNSISARQLKLIKNNPEDVEFKIPEDDTTKFHQLYDLVHMMIIDNKIHSEEKKLCNLFAEKFGYKRKHIEELIATIISNIKHKNGPNNTMKRSKWMLN